MDRKAKTRIFPSVMKRVDNTKPISFEDFDGSSKSDKLLPYTDENGKPIRYGICWESE